MTSSHCHRTITTKQLMAVIGLWLLLALLATLSRVLPELSNAALLMALGTVALPMAVLMFRRRRLRRQAALQVWLADASLLHRWLKGGALMFAGQGLLALGLSLTLLAGLARGGDIVLFWLALMALVPIWVMTYDGAVRLLSPHFNPPYQLLITQRIHGFLFGVFLLSGFAIWSLFQPVVNLIGVPIEAAILEFSHAHQAQSGTLQVALDVMAVVDGVRHWLAQNLTDQSPHLGLNLLVWLLVLVQEWLVVWPLLLLFQAVHALALYSNKTLPNKADDEPD